MSGRELNSKNNKSLLLPGESNIGLHCLVLHIQNTDLQYVSHKLV